MTTAVVDASVLVAALLDSGDLGRWGEEQLQDAEMAGPHLVLAEASNIIQRATIAGEIAEQEAAMANADLVDVAIELFPFAPFSRSDLGAPRQRDRL